MSVLLPTPEWLHGRWEPRDYISYSPIAWPQGFDPASLPQPPYLPGQTVAYRIRTKNGVVLVRGKIRGISLEGGIQEGDQEQAIQRCYHGAFQYIVESPSGHGILLTDRNIIKEGS